MSDNEDNPLVIGTFKDRVEDLVKKVKELQELERKIRERMENDAI